MGIKNGKIKAISLALVVLFLSSCASTDTRTCRKINGVTTCEDEKPVRNPVDTRHGREDRE